MLLFYYFCEAVFNVVKIIIAFHVVEGEGNPRVNFMKRRICFGILAVGITSLSLYNLYTVQTTMFSNALLWLISFITVVVINKIYRISWIEVLFRVYMSWSWVHITDFFVQAILYKFLEILGVQNHLLLKMGWERGFYILVVSATIYLFRTRIKNLLKYFVPAKKRALIEVLMIVLSTVILVYFQRIYIEFVTDQYMRHWSLLVMAIVVASGVIVLYVRKLLLEQQNQAQKIRIELLEKNYKQALEMYKEKSILLHDERHYIQMINGHIMNGELDKALDLGKKIKKKIDNSGTRIWSKNQTIDLILNLKAQEAREHEIAVEFQMENLQDLNVSESDLCVLFFNLLDNAIEANQKIAKSGERWIKLSGKKTGSIVFLNISNPLVDGLHIENGKILTSKREKKQHGFGMESIKKIIHKYQGELSVAAEDNIFLVEMFLVDPSNE